MQLEFNRWFAVDPNKACQQSSRSFGRPAKNLGFYRYQYLKQCWTLQVSRLSRLSRLSRQRFHGGWTDRFHGLKTGRATTMWVKSMVPLSCENSWYLCLFTCCIKISWVLSHPQTVWFGLQALESTHALASIQIPCWWKMLGHFTLILYATPQDVSGTPPFWCLYADIKHSRLCVSCGKQL